MDGSSSLSEGKVVNYVESGYSLAAYTSKRFVKSFPKGLRQDSSNMNPIPSWLCGIQSVAMNMQTEGEYLDLVSGLFRINGSCGYVLKPKTLMDGLGWFPFFEVHFWEISRKGVKINTSSFTVIVHWLPVA